MGDSADRTEGPSGVGPSGFSRLGSYLTAAFALPTSATTPSCCINPRASQLTQPSVILPLVEAGDGDACNGELLAGRSDPTQLAFVMTSASPTRGDGFAVGEEIFDGHVQILEGGAIVGCALFFTFGTATNVGRGRIVVRVIGRNELICYLQIALVPNFFHETANDSFI